MKKQLQIKTKDSKDRRGKVAIFSEQSLPLTVIDDFIVRALGKKGLYSKQNGEIKYKADIQKALSIKNRRERYLALKKIWDSITEERRKEWERSKESIKSGGRASHGQN